MKLIDILVQELPKRGGWPDGIDNITQYRSGELCFNDKNGDCINSAYNIVLPPNDDGRLHGWAYGPGVTREEYEAALKLTRNGEGVPPVGTECECSWGGDDWRSCKLLFVGDTVIVLKLSTGEMGYHISDVKFRPIRSTRDKAVEAFNSANVMGSNRMFIETAQATYDAIAAGKIPGVKLDN